ncbi:MAG TPA: hypothetical protein VLF69_04110 [Candidatus Saccharimonadales bacterium]|nr:hypothetical protein [Candidatus Saccharimonadales bacterium]
MDYSQHKHLEFRRKFWKLAGAEIYLSDPATQQEIGYIKMKAWKLREDVRLFTDRSMQREIFEVHARQIIDLGATYDVLDGATLQPVFSLKRKGLKSIFVRDHWDLLDNNGTVFGAVQETSSILALARRWLELLPFGELAGLIFSFVPQTYTISALQADGSSAVVGNVVHRKNPFIVKMLLDTSMAQATVHPFVPLAATTMLSIIDAAKNN